jgi:poly(3-hydroxybutyrate) depolymerase
MKTLPLLVGSCLVLALVVCGIASHTGTTTPSPAVNSLASGIPVSLSEDHAPGSGIPPGKGQFVFNDSLGNADRPITVYTYRPAGWDTSGPILFVMAGAGRTAYPSRDAWVPYAEQYKALVVAPEFSEKYYPGDMWYPLGYTYSETDWTPKANWTFTAIEHLFDVVRAKSGATTPAYLLDGHSAGGQFVHRMVTFLPNARFSRAVAANAGLYVLPVYSIPYPLGLKDSPLYQSELPLLFSRKLIIMSGDQDTNPNDGGLANFPAAEAQGSTRFERARNYFATAQQEAATLNVPLNWEYHVVPGVGHDETGMAGPSAAFLFNKS